MMATDFGRQELAGVPLALASVGKGCRLADFGNRVRARWRYMCHITCVFDTRFRELVKGEGSAGVPIWMG